jgi:Peptidase M50B-like
VGVLWAGIVLLIVALLWANNGFARAVTALGLAGVLWAAITGGPQTPAAVAFALVWLLLIGGVGQAVGDRGGSDGPKMAASTWIPKSVWWALWVAIAVICLWSGARLLLHLR